MRSLRDEIKVFVYLKPIDMRKAINGLSVLVLDALSQIPQSGHVFVFTNKAKNKVKCLLWEHNGFVLHYKRLERCRFKWPRLNEDGVIEINESQLNWLLAGLDFALMKQFSGLNYTHYYSHYVIIHSC